MKLTSSEKENYIKNNPPIIKEPLTRKASSWHASGEKRDNTKSSSLRYENVWDPNAREADLGIGVQSSVYTKDT